MNQKERQDLDRRLAAEEKAKAAAEAPAKKAAKKKAPAKKAK